MFAEESDEDRSGLKELTVLSHLSQLVLQLELQTVKCFLQRVGTLRTRSDQQIVLGRLRIGQTGKNLPSVAAEPALELREIRLTELADLEDTAQGA